MGKRIVIALGGNALGNNLPEQMQAVKHTARAIVDLIEQGNEVVVAHGNGPQVGMIQEAMTQLTRSNPEKYIPCPLSVCVAMSQGYIGYDLQNALREEMLDRGIDKGAATVLTQVEVDPDDPAFANPTKPIGAFMTREEADRMIAERGYDVIEDAGRGFRRVVASLQARGRLAQAGGHRRARHHPLARRDQPRGHRLRRWRHPRLQDRGQPPQGRGGRHRQGLRGGKARRAARRRLPRDPVAVNFGKPDQQWLDELTPADVERYIGEGQFAPGSMLPKVQAALSFAQSGAGRSSLITLLEKASDGIAGKTGTIVRG